MELGNQKVQKSLQRKEKMEEGKAMEAGAKLQREAKEKGVAAKLPLPTVTTSSSSPCSSPSHEFSFTISFQSPSAATTATASKSPSTMSRSSLFDLAPADDIFFHGHLLPLQLLSLPPLVSPRSSQDATVGPLVKGRDGERSRCNAAAADTISNSNSSSSSSSSAASSNGDAKERAKNGLLSSLFGGMGRWRKGGEAAEREDDDEKRRKRSAFDAMSRLVKRYVSAVEPLFSFRGRGKGRRGDLRRRPYSFAGNSTSGAAAGRREDLRHRRGQLSAPASMRTSPSNSGLLLAAPSAGASSDESTMEELRSAIEAAIAHCKGPIAMKDEKCKC